MQLKINSNLRNIFSSLSRKLLSLEFNFKFSDLPSAKEDFKLEPYLLIKFVLLLLLLPIVSGKNLWT